MTTNETDLAIFAEESFQIRRSSSGRQPTDPQIPATGSCSASSDYKHSKSMSIYLLNFEGQEEKKNIHSPFSSFDSVAPSFSSALETKEKKKSTYSSEIAGIAPHTDIASLRYDT